MTFEFRDLGALKHGVMKLNDLTIISGSNNSGKTYVSYTLCGYLILWRQFVTFKKFHGSLYQKLLEDGEAMISPDDIVAEAQKALAESCQDYSRSLHKVLAGTSKHLEKNKFFAKDLDFDHFKKEGFKETASRAKKALVRVSYEGGETPIKVSFLADVESLTDPHETANLALDFLDKVLVEHIVGPLFPEVFIASAERTGATIFQKELDLARNRLIEQIGESSGAPSGDLDLFSVISKIASDYALPVKADIDFIRGIESFSKEESWLAETHPSILEDFQEIIGGEYKTVKNQGTLFLPKGAKGVKLTMGESSSAVRSLLNVGAYLRHRAAPGQLLIIDEPELNLHPSNQRKVARLLARLVNVGIKVFITTHSDYLIKELNTLIMLSPQHPHLKKVMAKEGYKEEELLKVESLNVYQAKLGSCKFGDMIRAAKGMTLCPAKIDKDQGIWIESFDEEIEEMDRIQSAILYGDDAVEIEDADEKITLEQYS